MEEVVLAQVLTREKGSEAVLTQVMSREKDSEGVLAQVVAQGEDLVEVSMLRYNALMPINYNLFLGKKIKLIDLN